MTDLGRTSRHRLILLAVTLAAALVPGMVAAQTPQGPLTSGQNYTGTIGSLETHSWTLTAAVGDAIVLSIGEVGATDSPFTPWIGLFGPGNVFVASSFGTLTAHLNVNATVAGAYNVYVRSGDIQDAATGSYTLTLARIPETFFVPHDDEGGELVNGANHPGYIFQGDQDEWTFNATAGDNVSLSIGEVGADTNFAPWIRLFSPTGEFLLETFSQLGGKIDFGILTTGTYTVVVASADDTYSATGRYQLTLAAPGPFVVPVNDEGGPMTNGVVYQAAITRADLDQWVFNATAGAALSISAAELGGDSGFFPWIRLYDPAGVFLGGSFGATTAQIDVTATATGLYRVVVASADLTFTAAGRYSLTATGLDAPPAVDLGDVMVDFGAGYGLWIRANDAGPTPQWQQIHNVSPTHIARGDIDGTGTVSLVATFQGAGVWIWRSGTGWTQLHDVDASDVITADLDGNGQDDIILNFPGAGLWVRYNNMTWFQLHYLNSTALAAGNLDSDVARKADLIINFAGYGVWAWMNNAGWQQLRLEDATDLHAGDFDGDGQDDLVANFAGQGIWTRVNNGAWSQLHYLNSSAIAIGDIDGDALHQKDIIISFPGNGVYARMNFSSWLLLHPLNSPVLGIVDLEKNGKDDVIMNFPGNGTWIWKNNATWELLHPADIEGVASGRYDIN